MNRKRRQESKRSDEGEEKRGVGGKMAGKKKNGLGRGKKR